MNDVKGRHDNGGTVPVNDVKGRRDNGGTVPVNDVKGRHDNVGIVPVNDGWKSTSGARNLSLPMVMTCPSGSS